MLIEFTMTDNLRKKIFDIDLSLNFQKLNVRSTDFFRKGLGNR